MIPFERFGDDVESYLFYARGQTGDKAVEAFRLVLKHCGPSFGIWCRNWFNLATQLSHEGAWREVEWLNEFADALMLREPATDVAREMMPDMFWRLTKLLPESTDSLKRLVEWFVAADAGEAITAAKCLDTAWSFTGASAEDMHFPRVFMPLIEWLLQNGSAELRNPKWGQLTARIVEAADRYAAPEVVRNAVRFAVLHNGAAQAHTWYRPEGLWPAMERVLDLGESPGIVGDFLLALTPAFDTWGAANYFAPLAEGGHRLPKCRDALATLLVSPGLPNRVREEGLRRLLRLHPTDVPNLEFANADQLKYAAAQAMAVSNDQPVGHDSAVPSQRAIFKSYEAGNWPHLSEWGEALANAWLARKRAGEADVDPAAGRSLLYDMALSRNLWRGVRRALAAAADAGGLGAQLAAEVLASADTENGFVTVAGARLLFPPQSRQRIGTSEVQLGAVQQLLLNLVHHEWPDGLVGGVEPKKLFHGVEHLEVVPRLESDAQFKVCRDGNTLLVDGAYFREHIGRHGWTRRTQALAMLYFLHEYVHSEQGIGDIRTVRSLRSTGAENTLLQLDLAADHAAVFLAATAWGEMSALELRDVQSGSVTGFPSGPYHGAASRARKAARAVSCRADYLARVTGLVSRDTERDGYIFVEFGPLGGPVLMFTSGPPIRLVTVGHVSGVDAGILAACLDGPTTAEHALAQLDSTLRRAFAR